MPNSVLDVPVWVSSYFLQHLYDETTTFRRTVILVRHWHVQSKFVSFFQFLHCTEVAIDFFHPLAKMLIFSPAMSTTLNALLSASVPTLTGFRLVFARFGCASLSESRKVCPGLLLHTLLNSIFRVLVDLGQHSFAFAKEVSRTIVHLTS